jgi:6-phosphofructokinase 1
MHEVPLTQDELEVATLGERTHASPLPLADPDDDTSGSFVHDDARVLRQIEVRRGVETEGQHTFERAGPRQELFFEPASTRAAIVTCGGLCPGINNVVRSAYYQLFHRYGVRQVLGIRYGFQGLNPASGTPPVALTPELVEEVHRTGGTFLGSSRGPQNVPLMVDFLQDRDVDILLCVGGDGTQRAVHAIHQEVRRRGLAISLIGVPKTIDNDVPFVYRSFGFYTALEKAREVIQGAHVEARGVPRGVGLVKLMGRYAGFIAAGATLASQEVNFCLIPEVPFELEGADGFLPNLAERLDERGHAVVVVAEGAGQNLVAEEQERDASGNLKLADVGGYLRGRIGEWFRERGEPVYLKYFDPSYLIRSVPANTSDSLYCDSLARHAVHAAMAGKTDMLVGYWHNVFIHVPIPAAVRRQKRLDPRGGVWIAVQEATGQPIRFGAPVPEDGRPRRHADTLDHGEEVP